MKLDFSAGVYVPLKPSILHIVKRNTKFSRLQAASAHFAGTLKETKHLMA